MRVKCIDNGGWSRKVDLSIGKIYEVIDADNYIRGFYKIRSDKGEIGSFYKERFIEVKDEFKVELL